MYDRYDPTAPPVHYLKNVCVVSIYAYFFIFSYGYEYGSRSIYPLFGASVGFYYLCLNVYFLFYPMELTYGLFSKYSNDVPAP
jgi:hypothetical protein